jgi:hypothetical protein
LCLQTLIWPSLTWCRDRLSSEQWNLPHVLKFQLRSAKHHAKRDRRCWSANSGRIMTLLDLSLADFRRFLTVLIDRLLFGSQCCYENARLHHSRAVTDYLQCEAVTSVPWPVMSPDLNPIEHIWDMLSRRIHARNLLCKTRDKIQSI